jgi:acetylglutamate kinase
MSDVELIGQTLSNALPYIQRWRGRVVVVKYGGHALDGGDGGTFATDVALLHAVGVRPVVVHGGGPQISRMMERLGKTAQFVDGLRVTDAETIGIASMVLLGEVNPALVAAIGRAGAGAVGVSGQDAGLLQVVARDQRLGFVGDVHAVDPSVVRQSLDAGQVPVVATIGSDAAGQPYNVNADAAAAAIAAALAAEKLVYLTDVEGVRRHADDPTSVVSRCTPEEVRRMLEDGSADGGMIPKLESCLAAIDAGVRSVHIIDGRRSHALLVELFTESGLGTMITGSSS